MAARLKLTPGRKIPDPPEWLSTTAKREWRRVYPMLVETVGLDSLDRALLASYCESYSMFQRATKELQQQDIIHENERGSVMNPLLRVRREAAAEMVRTGKLLGLAPGPRKRLKAKEKPVVPDANERKFFIS